MPIDTLKASYPWPNDKPSLPFDNQGWFGWCHKAVMDVVLPKNGIVILELGSWLGLSTRFMLEEVPSATVLAIDHWRGDESILSDADEKTRARVPILYDQFISNCWKYKDRLIPIKETIDDGMKIVKKLDVKPDFIYLDASHKYDDAVKDLAEVRATFPGVRLAGDDYGGKWVGVKKAVDEYCAKYGMKVCCVEHAWTLALPEEENRIRIALRTAAGFRKEQMYRIHDALSSTEMASS